MQRRTTEVSDRLTARQVTYENPKSHITKSMSKLQCAKRARSGDLVNPYHQDDHETSAVMARASAMQHKLLQPSPHHRVATKNPQSTSATPLGGMAPQVSCPSPFCASAATPTSIHESGETSKTILLPASSSSTHQSSPNGRRCHLNALGVWLTGFSSYLYQLAGPLVWQFCRNAHARRVRALSLPMSLEESCGCAMMQANK